MLGVWRALASSRRMQEALALWVGSRDAGGSTEARRLRAIHALVTRSTFPAHAGGLADGRRSQRRERLALVGRLPGAPPDDGVGRGSGRPRVPTMRSSGGLRCMATLSTSIRVRFMPQARCPTDSSPRLPSAARRLRRPARRWEHCHGARPADARASDAFGSLGLQHLV